MPSSRSEMPGLTAREAADLLGIKPATVYAYVSRRLIRRISFHGHQSLYSRDDIDLLRRKTESGTAATALAWGQPVLESALTEVTQEGPRYRGKLFGEFIQAGTSFEQVAEFLWTGQRVNTASLWREAGLSPWGRTELRRLRSAAWPVHAKLLPFLAGMQAEWPADDRSLDVSLPHARRVVLGLSQAVSVLTTGKLPRLLPSTAAGCLAASVPDPETAEGLFDAALVACADHELNTSAFAGRVAASNGASIGNCLLAAAASHLGRKQGGAVLELERLLGAHGQRSRLASAVRDRLRRGETMPGFGHPLYPQGDPRATAIRSALGATNLAARRRTGRLAQLDLLHDMAAGYGLAPNIDFAFLELAYALGSDGSLAQFVYLIGRSAGWVAHVLEQRLSEQQIRPRAKFRRQSRSS